MERKYRVGMLIGRFYPYEGGTEIQCLRLSHELMKDKHGVFVLTQMMPGLKYHEIINGIPVFRLGVPWRGRLGSLTFIIVGFAWLAFNNRRFDILHAHLASSPALLGAFISKIFRKKCIVKFGGSRTTGDIATSSATWHGRLKIALLKRWAAALVCPSNEIRRELLAKGFSPLRIHVIPNGVDTDLFRPTTENDKKRIRDALRLPHGAAIAAFVGRLEPGKGIELLLDAWQELTGTAFPSARLLILGSGSLEPLLKSNHGSLASVLFRGWQRNVLDYLLASDLFVLSSWGEGLPNALIEAMACGLPCVCTRIGGTEDIITDKRNGIMVTPGDRKMLVQALRTALSDKHMVSSIGAAARAFAESHLSIKTAARRHLELYHHAYN